ncbi:MAG TPA: STAS domain-containing protein [Streptosporangiaceae bacterium]
MPEPAAVGSCLDVLRPGSGGCEVVMLTGDLDIASAPALRESLLELLRPRPSRLIINLSAVGYADASGAAVLVGIARRAGLLGGWLRLASPAPAVAKTLSITGVNRYLATFPTVEAAVTGSRGNPSPTPRRSPRAPAVYAACSARTGTARTGTARTDSSQLPG